MSREDNAASGVMTKLSASFERDATFAASQVRFAAEELWGIGLLVAAGRLVIGAI